MQKGKREEGVFTCIPGNLVVCLEMTYGIAFITSTNLILFCNSLIGIVFNRENIMIVLLALELMLLACNLNFIIMSVYLDDIIGQLFVIFVLTVAAAESAIGLAILTSYYRVKNSASL